MNPESVFQYSQVAIQDIFHMAAQQPKLANYCCNNSEEQIGPLCICFAARQKSLILGTLQIFCQLTGKQRTAPPPHPPPPSMPPYCIWEKIVISCHNLSAEIICRQTHEWRVILFLWDEQAFSALAPANGRWVAESFEKDLTTAVPRNHLQKSLVDNGWMTTGNQICFSPWDKQRLARQQSPLGVWMWVWCKAL